MQGDTIMRPRIKTGLIVGVIGFVLIIFQSGTGISRILTTMIASAIAGFLASQQERLLVNKERLYSKKKSTRAGAIAGGITGTFMLIGQLVSMIIAVTIGLETKSLSQASNASWTNFYYSTALVSGFCFGVLGILLAIGAGAIAGNISQKANAPQKSR